MATANQKAKASTIATRKLLRADRMAGFKATGSALDAIYGNLSTTQAGIGRSQTIANQKTMAALARLAGKTDRATGRIVRGGEAAAANRYGSVVGAAVDRESGAPEAHAAAASAVVGAERKAGAVGARGASDVLAITRAGAKAAAAGAAGQLADALSYRAKQDASIIAQMEQARLEANLQFQSWRRQQEYLSKQEEKDTTGALGGVRQATDTAGDAAVFFRTYRADNPEATVPEMLEAYHAKYGSLGGGEDPLLNILAGNVVKSTDENGQTVDGYTRSDEAADIRQALHTLYPSFGKVDVGKVINASLGAYDAQRRSDELKAAAEAASGAGAAPDPTQEPTAAQVGAAFQHGYIAFMENGRAHYSDGTVLDASGGPVA